MEDDITERRVHTRELADQVYANRDAIHELTQSVNNLKKEIEPLSKFFEDIETLARVGRCFRVVTVSVAGLLASLAIIWGVIQGWFNPNPPPPPL